jgi:hypothetical protein
VTESVSDRRRAGTNIGRGDWLSDGQPAAHWQVPPEQPKQQSASIEQLLPVLPQQPWSRHCSSESQTLKQALQWSWLKVTFVQTPPQQRSLKQQSSSDEQGAFCEESPQHSPGTAPPPPQICPAPVQATLQSPQFASSRWVSRQMPPQQAGPSCGNPGRKPQQSSAVMQVPPGGEQHS